MRIRSTAGFAVLLAVVLLLSAASLCAALTTRPPHQCCPGKTSPASEASGSRCCLTSYAPVIPVSPNTDSPFIWAALLLPAAIELPRSEAFLVRHPLFASPHIFLKFHQLLI